VRVSSHAHARVSMRLFLIFFSDYSLVVNPSVLMEFLSSLHRRLSFLAGELSEQPGPQFLKGGKGRGGCHDGCK